MSDGGKGSAQRPTNHKAFSDSFDRIFGKKTQEQPANPETKPKENDANNEKA